MIEQNRLSIWEADSFHRHPQVVVIGGGIVGLFTALFHKRQRPGHHVLVLEKGPFPSGASVRNAGFACFGSPSELIADMEKEGEAAAMARVEARWHGLRDLRQELGDEAIGLQHTGGHEVFTFNDPLYTKVMERFDRLTGSLRSIVGPDAWYWADDEIPRHGLTNVEHLAKSDLEAPIDSGRAMRTLLSKAIAEGVVFRGNAEVTNVEEKTGQVRIHLKDGARILADRVVLATNGHLARLRPELDVVPARGQVLLTGPMNGPRPTGTFHYKEGFYYFRDHGEGILIGGGRELDIEGETTDEEGTTDRIQQALERMLREVVIPGRDHTIIRRWSGIMAFGSRSKTPLVQRLSERLVVAGRSGGMGVAIGIRLARQAADLLE